MTDERSLHEVLAFADRTLSREEFSAYVDAPITTEERDAVRALHEWFVRRFPSALERLNYSRRKVREWQRAQAAGRSG